MSYKQIEPNKSFIKDIYSRKEFYSLENDVEEQKNKEQKDEQNSINYNGHLIIKSYQKLPSVYTNLNTPYHRICLKYGTGIGKSLTFITITRKFIEYFQKEYNAKAIGKFTRKEFMLLQNNTPTIYVLGFTKDIIIREFLKWPELGFITIAEKKTLDDLRRNADSKLPYDIKKYTEFLAMVVKRIYTKKKGGFYKFIGYKKLVNELFMNNDAYLYEIEKKVEKKEGTLVNIILKYVDEGKITINTQFLESFRNSVIICDEIHNTYNSFLKNNWGMAIQFILDYFPNTPAVFLSATPINNSPSEIVDLLNMLLPLDKKISKYDLFSNDRKLKEGSLEKIAKASIGYFSFLQIDDPASYPQQIFIGQDIHFKHKVDGLNSIPYIKFIPVLMSNLHQGLYNNVFNKQNSTISLNSNEVEQKLIEKEDDGELLEQKVKKNVKNEKKDKKKDKKKENETQQDRIPSLINDLALPNPDSNKYGIGDMNVFKTAMEEAGNKWKKEIMIDLNETNTETLDGDFLNVKNIGKYSGKMYVLMKEVLKIINKGTTEKSGEKIFLYHHNVKNAGVLLYENLLKANGIIGMNSNPVSNSICVVCGGKYSEHKYKTESSMEKLKRPNHQQIDKNILKHFFIPVRYIMAHNHISKKILDTSLSKYNSYTNRFGIDYKILVGSRMIKEGYDFKDVRHHFIMVLPINISSLIQLIGRTRRKDSHINLEPQMRTVSYYIYVYIDEADKDLIEKKDKPMIVVKKPTYELTRWAVKISDYLEIQKIERVLNQYSFDAPINRNLIMTVFKGQNNGKNNGKNNEQSKSLGDLYFESLIPMSELSKIKKTDLTFNAYGYFQDEINALVIIIKQLFLLNTLYTIDDLYYECININDSPIKNSINLNSKYFNKQNFLIALNYLVFSNDYNINNNETIAKMTEWDIINSLLNPYEKYIYKSLDNNNSNDKKITIVLYKIVCVGELESPITNLHAINKSKYIFVLLPIIENNTIIDVYSYMSKNNNLSLHKSLYDINLYLQNETINNQYAIGKDKLINYINLYNRKPSAETPVLSDKYRLLMLNNRAFYQRLIRDLIVYFHEKKLLNPSKDYVHLYHIMKEIYDEFKILIYAKECMGVPEIMKKIKFKKSIIENNIPIGYISEDKIYLYDVVEQKTEEQNNWQIFNANILRNINYKDNDIVIGFLTEDNFDKLTFKLKNPAHKIIIDEFDTRKNEKGIVCETKSKKSLTDILKGLGITTSEYKIKSICSIIRNKLIELEIKERSNNTTKKYFYI